MNHSLYTRWYKQENIKLAICNSLFNRELMLIDKSNESNTIRKLKCHEPRYLDNIFSLFNVEQRQIPYNLYYSLARYKYGIPVRGSDIETSFWDKHWDHMTQYDFVIDIDADENEMEYAVESAKHLHKVLKDFKHTINFSGRGFHFHINLEFAFIPFDPKVDNNIYQYYYNIAKLYHDTISEMIDLSIYDSRRVIRIPYSLSVYPHNDIIFICKPVSDIDKFDINDYILTEANFDRMVMGVRRD